VVRFEHRLEQEREAAQQRLFRAQPPIVGDVDEFVVLFERPDAATAKSPLATSV